MQVAMRNEGFNIVSQVSFIFFYISNHWDDTKVDIAQKTVQALIEMCTGDYINQDIAFKGQVIVSINLQLNMHSDNEEKRKLKSSCIELLEVMLEEIDEKSCTLAKCIANHLEMDKLYQEMLNLFDISNYELLCRAYNVLKRIADYEGISTEKLVEVKEDDKVHQAMWEYCRHRSRSVEIAYKNDTVTQAYFSYDPKIHIKDKSYIQSQIKRSTPQEKLLDFIEWTNAVEKMQSKKDIFTFFRNKIPFLILSRLRQWLLIFLTILLNLIVLFTVYTPLDYNMANGVCTTNSTDNETCSSTSHFQPILSPQISLGSTTVLEILGFVHAALAVMMVIEYFAGNWGSFSPLMELKEHLSCKKIFFSLSKIILGKNITYRLCLGSFKLYLQKPQQSVANDKNTLANEYYQISWSSFQSIYRIFFMVCSLVAWIPVPGLKYMYCLCMLYPFLKFDVVAYISRAIKRSIKQLASVFLLCFVFIYIYAVVSFALLNNYFSKDKDQFCGSLVQCFFTVSRLGLLSTLGSELEIRPNNDYEPNFTLYGFRTFYDLVFFIVVTTLGLNIIIAILVDRFSEMREKSDKVEEDNESRCFICSIERSMFDKDFKKHVTKEHNLWDYMRFIIHVKSLPENSHNALEKYVFDQVHTIYASARN
ncbi:PREDICTED: inositol 1,4,5-trisphosphate receptor-like protein A isoform X2 [Amphimedon queenslandica]|uniref:Ion transport domain-containing protein n=1 Tax=Amphimedon queenslandica TaxID=400682 RepID=A0AAN0JPU8_AMPQE|nr:PREDICTED: inositol 1,4,5-trisphosphate receptor-like protein A isoform X2 [Amphimedon queenslandica]|eukprot:XP_019858828.1 PREDICTED: inositol 1,4,5-trisphosphate receptor-like protein A isoform X2 [Amphimedon queenslandica]